MMPKIIDTLLGKKHVDLNFMEALLCYLIAGVAEQWQS